MNRANLNAILLGLTFVIFGGCESNPVNDANTGNLDIGETLNNPPREKTMPNADYDPSRKGSPVTDDPDDILALAEYAGFSMCHIATVVQATNRDGWVVPHVLVWTKGELEIKAIDQGPVWEARHFAFNTLDQYMGSADAVAASALWPNGDFGDHEAGALWIMVWTPQFARPVSITQEFDLSPQFRFTKPVLIHSGIELPDAVALRFSENYNAGARSNTICAEKWISWRL